MYVQLKLYNVCFHCHTSFYNVIEKLQSKLCTIEIRIWNWIRDWIRPGMNWKVGSCRYRTLLFRIHKIALLKWYCLNNYTNVRLPLTGYLKPEPWKTPALLVGTYFCINRKYVSVIVPHLKLFIKIQIPKFITKNFGSGLHNRLCRKVVNVCLCEDIHRHKT